MPQMRQLTTRPSYRFEGSCRMIDFVAIPNKIDPDCWTLDFGIPPGAGRVSVVFDHGEKKVYVDGELYLTFNMKSKEEAENA